MADWMPTDEQVAEAGIVLDETLGAFLRDDVEADWRGIARMVLATVGPAIAAEAETRGAREAAINGFDIHDEPHYHMPYCQPGCDIKTVRTWVRHEVVERHDPDDIAQAGELLREKIAHLRQTRTDGKDDR